MKNTKRIKFLRREIDFNKKVILPWLENYEKGLMKLLNDEFNCISVKEAEKELKRLKKEIRDLKK